MIEAVIASLGYAGGVMADKLVLSKYRIPVMRFIPLLFIWLAIITAVLIPRLGRIKMSAFSDWRYVGLLLAMILVATIWNILYYKGIQQENLHEFELIMLLSPLATVVLATILLPAERNAGIFIPALIASVVLIATRFRKHHATLGKAAWRTIAAMLLLSFESILIKELLAVFSPVSLYFIRTAMLALVFVLLYRPKIFAMPKRAFVLVILSAAFGVIQMVLKFYGLRSLGVVETTMILILGPFLVYLLSAVIFKESIYKRDLFATAVVAACILYVEFWK